MTAVSTRVLADALIDAVWLVEPINLHIVDMNQPALDLSGLAAGGEHRRRRFGHAQADGGHGGNPRTGGGWVRRGPRR